MFASCGPLLLHAQPQMLPQILQTALALALTIILNFPSEDMCSVSSVFAIQSLCPLPLGFFLECPSFQATVEIASTL